MASSSIHKSEPLSIPRNKQEDEDFAEKIPLLRSKKSVQSNLPGLDFLASLEEHYGYKLLVMLFSTQHLIKGFAASFISPCTSYLLASYKVSGPHMQVFLGVMQLPWAMKPIIGLISDALPINGYNKSPYIILSSIVGVASLLLLGMSSYAKLSVTAAVICLFFVQLQFSTVDLLSEAKYAEKMQSVPEHGPALMSYVWFGLQLGGLVSVLLIGPTMQYCGIRLPYIIAAIPASTAMCAVASGFLEERQLTTETHADLRQRLYQQKEACVLCLIMLACTVLLMALGLFVQDIIVNAVASQVVALIVLISFSILLRPEIAKVTAFFLIQNSMSLSIGGASFYFYTDTAKEYPNGPHFSMWFYTSVLGIFGSVFSLLGIYSYQKYATGWNYQSLLFVSNLLLTVLSFSDVILFSRLNLKLGIPDHAFVLGGSALATVVQQWQWMPGVIMISQLCPKGMEAIMYSLLAGCFNLGSTISSNSGALFLQVLDIKPTGTPADADAFKYLWVGSAISTVLPTVSLFLIPWLVPNCTQTEKILTENEGDATAGSLWRRWIN